MAERGTKTEKAARPAPDLWMPSGLPVGEAAAGPPPDGWYELKYVRGCGPYLYFRYYDGNVRRSIYLGKADLGQIAWVRKIRGGRVAPKY